MRILPQWLAKRHLGVSNATDITPLIHMGLGRALKIGIEALQDEWMEESIDGVDKYSFTEADAGDLPDLCVSDKV